MKTIQISDELYDQLKTFVVDPFDDTPDAIVSRLVDIVNKARQRWSPLDAIDANSASEPDASTDNQEETQNGFVSRTLSEATAL
jgi:hypothetical protein